MNTNIKDLIDLATSEPELATYFPDDSRLVKGRPEQKDKLHFSAEDKFFVGEWGAEVGCWKVIYTENEYFHILEGKSIIRDLDGNEIVLKSGDKFCVPAGFEGEWEVIEPTQKIYVIYES